MASMAVGPAVALAGNEIQLISNGKIRITNSEGKVKTLSQDQFEKQLLKNADKIEAGEDVEFKKSKKGLIAAAATGAAVIGTLAALGIAHKNGKLKIEEIAKDDVLLKKAAKKINNAAEYVGRKVHEYSSDFVDFIKRFAPEAKKSTKKVAKESKTPKAPKAPKEPKASKASNASKNSKKA